MGAVGIGVTCMGAVGIMGAPSMGLETIGAVGTLISPPGWSEGVVNCGAMGGDDNVDMGVSPAAVPPPALLVVVVVLAAAFVFWRPCLRMMR